MTPHEFTRSMLLLNAGNDDALDFSAKVTALCNDYRKGDMCECVHLSKIFDGDYMCMECKRIVAVVKSRG